MIKRILLWTLSTLLILVILIASYAGITYWRASSGLPEWNGTLTAEGLDGPVEIVRDEHGIPYIEATTERDLYFAQGFVHAQDRFWQMEITRRTSQGRLSEWLGAVTLSADRAARWFDWPAHADRSWSAVPDEEKILLKAYAAGVNAWLESPAYRRPPEMKILHVHPEPWQPQDAFHISYQVYLQVAGGGPELTRARITAVGADSAIYDIFDSSDLPTRTIIEDSDGSQVMQSTMPVKERSFSNSWTISGEHTESGLPLMANDPQLAQTLPGTWQLQHHRVGDRIAAGGSMPGLPGIVVGHNGSISWGATTASIDPADLALLEVHPEDPNRYRRNPDAPWESFIQRVDTIQVRFGSDVVDTIRSTPYGRIRPQRPEVTPFTNLNNVVEEFRDLTFDHESGFPLAPLRIMSASTVEEGISASEALTFPPMNISFADTSGAIGYVAAARIPQRPEQHARFVDLAPDDDNDWSYLPYEENPRVVNPRSGRIVTANQRIIGDHYPHYLSDSGALPWRTLRIHEELDNRKVHNIETFRAMQQDDLSPVARDLIPLLLNVEPADASDAALSDTLRGWDYRFGLNSAAPTIFLTWTEMLSRRLIADEVADISDRWRDRNYLALIRALSGERSDWCDDTSTENVESCETLLQKSLTDARLELEKAFGQTMDDWTWGATHRMKLPHLGFAGLPLLDNMFSREVVMPGGPESLFLNAVSLAKAPYFSQAAFNSAYQGIYDLSNLDSSLFMTGGGSSGHFKSPYYNNFTEMWVRGERIKLNPEEREEQYTLILQPEMNQ
ncbi:penicillin acylase family protein [Rhodohalobacter sulfatireducens]|uniref:Penicillin acylase family protein n=1 Tax=Rhodohalobacter sulfatireducens TaxID=2911366 RepID=A0ABS9KGD5_9BACT|nr:penicillin acylase family protein [Rhodohalobacter sulfatireducens]MCG2589896.1 penicillin acylase family protein [Rhodohalobacter sulfatireducens]